MRDTRYVWSKCKSYNIIIIIGSQSPSALTRDLLLDRYRRTLWAQIMYIMIQWRVMHFWYNFVWIVHSLFTAPFKFKKFNVRWAVHHDALSFGCCGGLQADWETVSSHGHYMSKGDFRKREKKKKRMLKSGSPMRRKGQCEPALPPAHSWGVQCSLKLLGFTSLAVDLKEMDLFKCLMAPSWLKLLLGWQRRQRWGRGW